eukprot:SAG31_NODE_36060_length_317_cov_0.573394_1_plen_46_part_01
MTKCPRVLEIAANRADFFVGARGHLDAPWSYFVLAALLQADGVAVP